MAGRPHLTLRLVTSMSTPRIEYLCPGLKFGLSATGKLLLRFEHCKPRWIELLKNRVFFVKCRPFHLPALANPISVERVETPGSRCYLF